MTERLSAPASDALLDAFAPTIEIHGPPGIDFVVAQESAVDGVAVTVADPSSGQAHLVYTSSGLNAMVGQSADQLFGRPLLALFGDDPPRALLASLEATLGEGEKAEASIVLRHRSGSSVATHSTHVALPSLSPTARYRLILFRDLSKRSSEQLLADQSAVIDSLARGQDLGSLCHEVAVRANAMLAGKGTCWIGVADIRDRLEAVVTAGHDIDFAGRIMRLVMGTGDPTSARSVVVDNMPADLSVPLREAGVRALWCFPALDSSGYSRGALIVAVARIWDGGDPLSADRPAELLPGEEEIRVLDYLSRVVAAAVERAALEADLALRAAHDPLTRLPNRALIVERLEQALARLEREPSSVSVLLVDIERFKSINDTWGADVGDRVLLEVAARLLTSVRLGDTVGRVSSDQFLMICFGNPDFDAGIIAQRVIESMTPPIPLVGGGELRISVSIGVVAVDDPTLTPATVIGNAESALARAGAEGRGQYALFDTDLQSDLQYEASARLDIEQALHGAIEGRELVLHYQPVCEVATGRMIGAEALVRWDRPGHGLLNPGDFIEIAEDTGLIVPLGVQVIDQVTEALAGWPRSADGRWPVVTVNLSARQLADQSIVSTVVDALERHRLVPARIGFEVTESMQIDDFEAAVDALNALSDLGCRIAIDDFGIGYATLDYLKRFSMADVIKIDRSFVAGLGRSREDSAIVSASMALASGLRLRVVAEGVESNSQLELLDQLGCHYAQGYALSPPVPLDQALELWADGILKEN